MFSYDSKAMCIGQFWWKWSNYRRIIIKVFGDYQKSFEIIISRRGSSEKLQWLSSNVGGRQESSKIALGRQKWQRAVKNAQIAPVYLAYRSRFGRKPSSMSPNSYQRVVFKSTRLTKVLHETDPKQSIHSTCMNHSMCWFCRWFRSSNDRTI